MEEKKLAIGNQSFHVNITLILDYSIFVHILSPLG
jgi:hypothetical protein